MTDEFTELTVQVKCYSGYKYAQRPESFIRQGVEYKLQRIEKEWQEPGERHFLVCTESSNFFELWYNEAEDKWRLAEIVRCNIEFNLPIDGRKGDDL